MRVMLQIINKVGLRPLVMMLPPLPQLEPWAHFVPAAVDLSDLDVRVKWALEDPAAEAVAQRCRELYDELCAPGRAVRSLVGLFSELAAVPAERS